MSATPITGDVCINFSIACILLVNNEVIKKIGLFNKKYFIYWEDFELFRRLKLNKIPAIKSYNSVAHHLWKKSTNVNLVSQFIMDVHHHKSAYIYFNVSKNYLFFFKKFFVYTFRFITYLFILNIKKSLKNLARLYAIYLYLKKISLMKIIKFLIIIPILILVTFFLDMMKVNYNFINKPFIEFNTKNINFTKPKRGISISPLSKSFNISFLGVVWFRTRW